MDAKVDVLFVHNAKVVVEMHLGQTQFPSWDIPLRFL